MEPYSSMQACPASSCSLLYNPPNLLPRSWQVRVGLAYAYGPTIRLQPAPGAGHRTRVCAVLRILDCHSRVLCRCWHAGSSTQRCRAQQMQTCRQAGRQLSGRTGRRAGSWASGRAGRQACKGERRGGRMKANWHSPAWLLRLSSTCLTPQLLTHMQVMPQPGRSATPPFPSCTSASA